MCAEFHWPHDFYEHMLWDVFHAWLEALKRRREGETTSPHSWKNADRDPWWEEARRLRDEQRGR